MHTGCSKPNNIVDVLNTLIYDFIDLVKIVKGIDCRLRLDLVQIGRLFLRRYLNEFR